MGPEEHIGFGSVTKLEEMLDKRDAGRIFLVAGRTSFDASGAASLLLPILTSRTVERFSAFSENPKLEEVIDAGEKLRAFAPDIVLAVGGGSAIDVAKAAALLARQNDGPLREYAVGTKPPAQEAFPIFAIPTTAGTGSEATHFAVFYEDGIKRSLAHPSMRPQGTLIDPGMLRSLTSQIKAATGMDALSQAIESYWSVRATDESKAYAQEAIPLIARHLVRAVEGADDAALLAVATGAHAAGKAINISFTTACHALSYRITSQFGVPHGHAVALTLPAAMCYNAAVSDIDVAEPRGVDYVRSTLTEISSLLGASDAATAARSIEELMARIGLARNLSAFGATESDLDSLAEGAREARMDNNPRRMSVTDARTLLAGIL